MSLEVLMRFGIACIRGTVAAAVLLGCSSIFPLASGCLAAAFTDPAAFAAAAAAAGIPISTDDFSTHPLGDIANGQTLGRFTYTFDPNPGDPTGTQPTIALDGSNQVLTGAPFDAFVGGNSVTLSFTGGKTLLAFGATFTYAPADEPLLANLYDLGILDGAGATTIGNPAGLSADGGSFFLGFIGSAGQAFSQISLFSLVDPPDGTTGSPFLIPAYEVNGLAFGPGGPPPVVPEPGSLGLLAIALAIATLPAKRRRKPNSTFGRQHMLKTSTFRVAVALAAMCLPGPAWALGSTPVTVVNPADIAKAEGIQHPYQAGIPCAFGATGIPSSCSGSLTAPPTQRLVIEYVSAGCGLNPGVAVIGASLGTSVAGSFLTHSLAAPVAFSENLSQQVRLYADPGSTLEFTLDLSAVNPGGGCIVSISGQAIEVP